MSDETSTRLGLPLLQPGQAQKELSHNEALTLLDMAVQASVEAVGLDTPPEALLPGACWIVGAAPRGAWRGQAQALAGWTAGGWRFVAPQSGMLVWSKADRTDARFDGSRWTVGTLAASHLILGGFAMLGPPRPAIAAPANGSTIDAEARATITTILAALQTLGLIAAA